MKRRAEAYDRKQDRDLGRLGARVHPMLLMELSVEQTPWYESEIEVCHLLAYGRTKAAQLAWVKGQMVFRLSKLERWCIRLYYFRGYNYRSAGARLGIDASTVQRTIRKAIVKLRRAARSSKWGVCGG